MRFISDLHASPEPIHEYNPPKENWENVCNYLSKSKVEGKHPSKSNHLSSVPLDWTHARTILTLPQEVALTSSSLVPALSFHLTHCEVLCINSISSVSLLGFHV